MIIIANIEKKLERLYHFEYLGKSTDTILESCPLQIVFFNEIGELGTTLEKVEGNATISRPRTNEYGVLTTPLSFEMGLIKQNEQPFDSDEARSLERWLTSPLYSSELKVESCHFRFTERDENDVVVNTWEEYEDTYYSGLFLQTRWERGSGGLYLCTVTFLCQDPYPYQRLKFSSNTTDNPYTINLNIPSDELEKYVYPVIRIIPRNNASNSSFTLIQRTDGANQIEVKTTLKRNITLDCRNCMAYFCTNELDGYQRTRDVTFKELGWDKTDNIYWPRFISGVNTIEIQGDVDIITEVKTPLKKVGGWLL